MVTVTPAAGSRPGSSRRPRSVSRLERALNGGAGRHSRALDRLPGLIDDAARDRLGYRQDDVAARRTVPDSRPPFGGWQEFGMGGKEPVLAGLKSSEAVGPVGLRGN